MWNNLIGQIREKVDNAVDLLKEDEEDEEGLEEMEEEEELAEKSCPTQPRAAIPFLSHSPQPAEESHIAPPPTVAKSTTDDGWSDEDFESLPVLPSTNVPTKESSSGQESPPPALAAGEGICHSVEDAQAPNVEKEKTAEGAFATDGWEDSENDIDVPSNPMEKPPLGESPASASAWSQSAGANAMAATQPNERDETNEEVSPQEAVQISEPVESATTVAELSVEASVQPPTPPTVEAHVETEPPSEDLSADCTSAVKQGNNATAAIIAVAACADSDNGAQEPSAAAEDVEEPVKAVPTETTAVPLDTQAQLLRFQQQLAEEMENNAALSDENASLKQQLSETTSALHDVQKKLSSSGNMEAELSTLIEKLGREKERCKTAVGERNDLRDQVQELEAIVDEYRVKEATWSSDQSTNAESQSSAQKHIVSLESELRKCSARVDELETKLTETERARGVLEGRLQNSESAHQSAMEKAKECSSESLEQAEREVERLRAALRRSSIENDERVGDLEQQLREANGRAHYAEERLGDLERGSVGSLRDLRAELEDMQSRMSSLISELNGVRGEHTELLERYSSLKKARATEEVNFRERQSSQAAATATLTEENADLKTSLAAAREKANSAEVEVAGLKRQCMMLEAANTQLKAMHPSGNPGRPSMTPNSVPNLDNNGQAQASPSLPGSTTYGMTPGNENRASQSASLVSSPAAPSAGRSAFSPPPLFTPAQPYTFGGTGAALSTVGNDGDSGQHRGRLEREIVRQAVEIERLKKTEMEVESLRRKLQQMSSEYDLLLQMYGQVEEEQRSKVRGTPSAPQ